MDREGKKVSFPFWKESTHWNEIFKLLLEIYYEEVVIQKYIL